jgi:hypothetical protein
MMLESNGYGVRESVCGDMRSTRQNHTCIVTVMVLESNGYGVTGLAHDRITPRECSRVMVLVLESNSHGVMVRLRRPAKHETESHLSSVTTV